METIKAQVEGFKSRLGCGQSTINVDLVLGEIESILQLLGQTKEDPKPKPRRALDSDDLVSKNIQQNFDDPTTRFWYEQHLQLRRCGFPNRPFSRDVNLDCSDGFVAVHSVVLVAASTFFRDIIKNREDDTIVFHLPDWTLSDLIPVLDLLYTGQSIIRFSATSSIWNLLDCLKINIQDISLSQAKPEEWRATSVLSTSGFTHHVNPQNLIKNNSSNTFNGSLESVTGEQKLTAPRTQMNQKPCAVLTELSPMLKYEYETPGSQVIAKAFFEGSNKWYMGVGNSKKIAKNDCASQILEDLGISVKHQAPATATVFTSSINEISGGKSETKVLKENPTQKPQSELGPTKPELGPTKPELGPTKPDLGPKIPEIGPKKPELGPTKPELGPTQPELGPTKPNLGTAKPELGPTKPNLGTTKPELGPTKPNLVNTQPELGPLKPELGPKKPDLINNFGSPEVKRELDINELKAIENLNPDILQKIQNIIKLDQNPGAALSKLQTSFSGPPKYDFPEEMNPPGTELHSCRLTFGSMVFTSEGPSKKNARLRVAAQALKTIFGLDAYSALVIRSRNLNGIKDKVFEPPKFSDYVHRIIHEKYQQIMESDPEHSSHKVLAGIVVTRGPPLIQTASVIAVTTGSKFITGKSLANTGLPVNDCHAEILATRCLRDFLYNQIELLLDSKDEKSRVESIFELDQGSQQRRFRLKDEVQFHLYISTAPCGDARLFTGGNGGSDVDPHPTRSNRGLLRAM